MVGRQLGKARGRGAPISATRFLSAARQWNAELVKTALQSDPHLTLAHDASGRTALHLCAGSPVNKSRRPASSSVATARALVAAGCDVNHIHHIPDAAERFPATALWHAIARGHNRALARFLLNAGSHPDYCLWAVVWDDDLVTARLLHQHNADLNLTFHGETPLLYATRLRRTRMIKWLLRNGADPNVADEEGRTPLLYAVRRRHSLAEVSVLLKAGADVTAEARDGSTPLSRSATARDRRLSALLNEFVRS